jgi:hypothetical protein
MRMLGFQLPDRQAFKFRMAHPVTVRPWDHETQRARDGAATHGFTRPNSLAESCARYARWREGLLAILKVAH